MVTSTGKIALWGAAGAVGKSVAGALDAEGLSYRVVGRNRVSLSAAFGGRSGAEIITLSEEDPASARATARGVETLVYLVGVPYDQFRLHPVVMRQTLEAAVAEGVKRVLLIGTVYPYGLPRSVPVKEDHPREPNTFKGRMRKEAEDLLLDAEAKGQLQAAILRLPDFYGPGVEKSFLDGLFKAAAKGGTAYMIGPIETPHQFVYVPDVGPVVTALMAHEGAWGKTWHFGGSGVATQKELAEKVFAMAGRKPKIFALGKTWLRVMGIFSPMMREMVEMNYLQTNPVVLDDSALRALLGGVRATSYEEGLRASLEAARD
jgi:nucleoside-diphosphate-sugar epimerase